MLRINIGCSDSPTEGWENFDCSLALRFSKFYFLIKFLHKLNLVTSWQYRIASFYKKNNIRYANAAKKIPLKDNSVEVIYSSHMIEHLTKSEAKSFLQQAYRVLNKGGIIRLAVPDLRRKVLEYLEDGDADRFVYETHMWYPEINSFFQKFYIFLTSPRHHLWMYDYKSMSKLLKESGFKNIVSLEPKQTTIINPGKLNLEERAWDSFYVEANK